MQQHTNPRTTTATKAELVEAYKAMIADKIATYPAQAANAEFYAAELAGAQYGSITRKVRTKGGHSEYLPGDKVLLFVSEQPLPGETDVFVTVWSLGRTNGTMVRAAHVALEREASAGWRHQSGLVTLGGA